MKTKLLLTLLIALLCGCSAMTIDNIFANTSITYIQLKPAGKISDKEARIASAEVARFAQELGLKEDTSGRKLDEAMIAAHQEKKSIWHAYNNGKANKSSDPQWIVVSSDYTPGRMTFTAGVTDGSNTGYGSTARRLQKELFRRLSDALGKDRVEMHTDHYFDPS